MDAEYVVAENLTGDSTGENNDCPLNHLPFSSDLFGGSRERLTGCHCADKAVARNKPGRRGRITNILRMTSPGIKAEDL